MHFCAVAARTYGRLSKPRNTSLNWFMPAFVKSSVGSSPGTNGLDGTTACPLDSKNFRNVERISLAFMAGKRRGRIDARAWGDEPDCARCLRCLRPAAGRRTDAG